MSQEESLCLLAGRERGRTWGQSPLLLLHAVAYRDGVPWTRASVPPSSLSLSSAAISWCWVLRHQKFVKSESGVSCVGCDFPCVTHEEPLNHRTDHENKFSLLPPAEHVDHFPQLNHQLISLFDGLSTFEGSRKSCSTSHRAYGQQ